MPNAKLKFDEREIKIDEAVTTVGRASDNTISLANDSNISRYHAEIERRGDDFYLIELGSSNGTTVNGERVESERLLNDGDVILLGNSSVVEFYFEKEDAEEKAENSAAGNASSGANASLPNAAPEIVEDTKTSSKFPVMLAVAGVACGLAVIFVVAVILFSYSGAKSCEASASILKPDNFETLKNSTEIAVETADATECARRAIFLLDDAEFASADEPPFAATLDPNDFPLLADGMNHSLKIVLEDAEGNKMPQAGEVLLVFETRAVETPTPTQGETTETPTPTPKTTKGKVTLTEVQAMSDKLIKSLGNSNYKLDKEFLEEVQKKTAEYAAEGFFARAQTFQDAIKNAYLVETDVGAPLGFLTAMSRSKFNLQKQGADEGLWQMSNEFAAAYSLNIGCEGDKNLSEPSQICAAKASSIYLKSLLRTVFEGDAVYTIAAFGMSPDEAFTWKQALPQDRADFWKVIKSQKQRDELIKFFAAGIVAENPQKFGMKKDNPISQLY